MFTPIKEAAQELRVSERFLRQLVNEGKVPFYRLSPRTLRIDLDELRNFMRLVAGRKQENSDTESATR